MEFTEKELTLREAEQRKIAQLMPEFLQLDKETQQVRKQLQKAKLKRDNLIGVVRFLRRKYRMMKKISVDSKSSENGHVNQYVRSSPPTDQFECATTKFESAMAPTCEEGIATKQFQSAIAIPTDDEKATLQQRISEAKLLLNLHQNSKIDHLAATEFKRISEPRCNPTFVQSNKSFLENNGLVLRPAILKNNSKEFRKPFVGKRKISWEDETSLTL